MRDLDVSSSSDSSIDEQKRMAIEFKNKELKLGDKWYLINSDWFTKWTSYIGLELDEFNNLMPKSDGENTTLKPDKINNKSLLTMNPVTKKLFLKDNILEDTDYYTVPEELWNYLVKIYGLSRSEDEIRRVVIDDSLDNSISTLKIEIRPLNVSLSCNYQTKSRTASGTSVTSTSNTHDSQPAHSNIVTEEMSRQASLDQVIERIRKLFNVPQEKKTRLLFKSKYDDKSSTIQTSPGATLSSSGYGIDDVIVLDVEDENGSWTSDSARRSAIVTTPKIIDQNTVPPPPPDLSTPTVTSTRSAIMTRSSYDSSYSYSNRQGTDYRPGLCGLSNLGNTCFMNSALQCMSNVPILTEFFRTGAYKQEINRQNPLGRKGEIAEAYAELINEMWSGQNSYTIPRTFKLNISRFAPQFTGYQQQDSQELLAFLLDGLHEDLNRILKKPYVEMGSHEGKTDAEFAEESWQDHKKRNDSIIVDTFHGLLKSTLNCLECGKISIKFDPFCYLSVPMPSKKERQIEIVFVPLDQTQPLTKYKVSVLKNGNMQDLCGAVEAMNGVPKSRMMVTEIYSNKFYKLYEPSDMLSQIKEREDIFVYELSTNYSNPEYLRVKVFMREKGNYISNSMGFGMPAFFMVPKAKLTVGSLYQHSAKVLRRFLHFDDSNQKSLNVNDEGMLESNGADDELDTMQQDDDNETMSSSSSSTNAGGLRSSERLRMKNIQKSKLFNLVLAKSENFDHDGDKTVPSDDTPFDWQSNLTTLNQRDSYSISSSAAANGKTNLVVSLVAEFPKNTAENVFNRRPLEEIVEHASCSAHFVKKKDQISLADCFNLYTKTEELSEQDYWYCSQCKEHKPSTKKFDLWSLPQVLVVHLKRFSYSRHYRDKLDTHVDFPLTDLDLTEYLINKNVTTETKYDLIAVSNHYGSLGGGHYTAYGKNRHDGRWYYFDDSSVSSSDESNVCTPAAYLLVYLRKDMHKKYIHQSSTQPNDSNAEKMDC